MNPDGTLRVSYSIQNAFLIDSSKLMIESIEQLLDPKADLQLPVDGEQGCFAALSKLKKQNPQIKTLLSVGGGSGSANFSAVAANSNSREAFARTAREFVDRFSLDGIDRKLKSRNLSSHTHTRSEKIIHPLRAS